MPLQNLSLSVAGEMQLARGFDVLAADARDLRDPLQETHDYLRRVIGDQFESEGAHGGSRWQDLSTGYAEQKAEEWGDGLPILVASGDMRAAWLARQPVELTSHRLVMGPAPGATNREGVPIDEYALAHQQGQGNMPQRKIVNLTTGDKRGIDRIFVEFFSSRTRKLIGAR